MNHTTRFARFAAAFSAVGTVAAMCIGAAHAYTIITRDGHRIEAQSAPEVRGLQAYMRLAPRGQLAVILEEKIDWTRTQAANGKPALVAVPANAQRAEAPSEKPVVTGPIEKTIVGKPATPSGSAEPPAVAGKPPQAPGALVPGSEQAQEAIMKLREEQTRLTIAREKAFQERKLHEAELQALESREAGYAGTDNNVDRRIQELKERIAEANAEIGKLDSRIAAISLELVQLGDEQ